MKKIVLLCAAGMSTSMLVKKMQVAAVELGFEVKIEAHPAVQAKEVTRDADLVLLGPQVRHLLNRIKTEVSCPAEAIDISAYGMMDGKKVINQAISIIGK